jgi:rhomboid protease GluP
MKFLTHTVVRGNWLTRKIDPSAAMVAAVLTLVLFAGSLLFWKNTLNAEYWMAATRDSVVTKHEWWRAWSTLLVHADAKHLLSNCLLFFILGSFVFGYFGYLAFPVLAFAAGGLTNLLVLSGMPAGTQLIGASGVVFWMGGFWLVLYFLIERRKSLTQRALRATGVGLVLFFPAEAFQPGISYMSHFIGFISGVLFGTVFYLFNKAKIQHAEIKEVIFEFDEDDESLSTNHD